MKHIFKYFVILYSLNFIEGTFRCDYTYSAAGKGWFKHFIIPATWYDALLRCTLEGSMLASPTTPEITNEIVHIINNFLDSKSEIFTGFSATFSQGDYFTYEGTPLIASALPWADDEPDNKDNDESCIAFNGSGELLDKPCGDTRPYICYRPENSTIDNAVNECGTDDPEYRFDNRTKSCYKFHTVPRNFSRAFFACTAEGGHLAIINSQLEAKVLKELFAKYPAGKMLGNFWKDVAFIGFHALNEKMDWKTIHGETLWQAGYGKFSGGEPNNRSPGEDCGSMYRSGLLNDLWCDRIAAFICEKNPITPAVCEAEESTTETLTTEIYLVK